MKPPGIGRRHIPDWWVVAASCTYSDQPQPDVDEHGRPFVPDGGTDLAALLAGWTGQPRKVCLAAIDRATVRGFINRAYSDCRPTDVGLALVQSPTFVRWEVQEAWWTEQFARDEPHDGRGTGNGPESQE